MKAEFYNKMFGASNKNRYEGVTLIELLVVISIIGIMSLAGLYAWQSSKKDTYLRNAQRDMASVIKMAQSYALQGKTQMIGGSLEAPEYYGVRFLDNRNYEIFYIEGSSSYPLSPAETFTLKNGVYVSGVSGQEDIITFKVPFANKSVSLYAITFQLGGESKQLQVADFIQES